MFVIQILTVYALKRKTLKAFSSKNNFEKNQHSNTIQHKTAIPKFIRCRPSLRCFFTYFELMVNVENLQTSSLVLSIFSHSQREFLRHHLHYAKGHSLHFQNSTCFEIEICKVPHSKFFKAKFFPTKFFRFSQTKPN